MPKNGPQYVVRSERGRFTLITSPQKKSALAASTEDARLTVSMRIAAILGGLVFAALGFGLTAVIVLAMRKDGISALLWLLGLFVVPLLIAGYGLDLMVRGILGRPWSRGFWRAAERWLTTRVKPWHWGVALVLLFGIPTLADVAKEGWSGLESVVIPLAILAQVVLHEAGHLAVAGAVGYRPRQLVAGPFILHVDGPRPRLSLGMMFFGGLAFYEPVRRTRQKDLWVVIAGPLANLLASALAMDAGPARSGFLEAFLGCFLWVGIAMGLFNLIPFPRAANGFALDGRELLDLLRGR